MTSIDQYPNGLLLDWNQHAVEQLRLAVIEDTNEKPGAPTTRKSVLSDFTNMFGLDISEIRERRKATRLLNQETAETQEAKGPEIKH